MRGAGRYEEDWGAGGAIAHDVCLLVALCVCAAYLTVRTLSSPLTTHLPLPALALQSVAPPLSRAIHQFTCNIVNPSSDRDASTSIIAREGWQLVQKNASLS